MRVSSGLLTRTDGAKVAVEASEKQWGESGWRPVREERCNEKSNPEWLN